MPLKSPSLLALIAGLAGSAAAQTGVKPGAQPTPRTLKARPAANISVNIRTGEKIVSPIGAATRTAPIPLWINNNSDPCGTGAGVGIIDTPDTDGDTIGEFMFFQIFCEFDVDTPCEGSWNNWWGDIPADSVVDRVVIAYAILAPDTDENGDGVGDGIEGYDLILSFADNDDGFGADGAGSSARSCIIELTIPGIPGATADLLPGYAAVYTLTLDLAETAPSLVFELGDSDGVDDAGTGYSGGSLYGHPTFRDRDGDTLHDFSYALRFDQSSLPFQPDGPVPGQTKGANGFVSVAPRGCTAAPCPTPTDPPGAGDDGTDIYSTGPSCPPSITTYIGTFWFGGFSCELGNFNASCYLELYGTPHGACSPADNAPPYGALDFSDVLGFVTSAAPPGSAYAAGFAPPQSEFDFSDVLAFLGVFAEGCP